MTHQECWICGATATTAEHLIKKSDLAGVFGKPKPRKPLFLHSPNTTNHIIQGLNADALKLKSRICKKCNNERTQPYDRAWEAFSEYVRGRVPQITPGAVVRANRIFKLSSNMKLGFVQLYFCKIFGCLIHEHKIPINLKPFSQCLLERKCHPDVFIKIGCVPREDRMVGVAGLATATDSKTGHVLCAQWFYELDSFAVNIVYTPCHDFWGATEGAWHPRLGTGRLLVHDFSIYARNSNDR